MGSDSPRRPVKTVNTAMEIIHTLRSADGMTLSEIAAEIELAKSTTHRHLVTLVDNEFLVRDGSEYRLSFRLLDIGTQLQHDHPLYTAGREYIDELAAETGERVWLSTVENGFSVSLYWASERNPLFQYSRSGTRRPLHVSAVGKAMLAQLSRDKIEAYLDQEDLTSRTKRTITSPAELRTEIEAIQRQGYAVSTEETVTGMNGVAVAISDEQTNILGGISIGCSANRLDDSTRDEFVDTLRETADEMAIRTRFS